MRWTLPCKQRMELDASYMLKAHSLVANDWKKTTLLCTCTYMYVCMCVHTVLRFTFYPSKQFIIFINHHHFHSPFVGKQPPIHQS
jgi:hypothetical protein